MKSQLALPENKVSRRQIGKRKRHDLAQLFVRQKSGFGLLPIGCRHLTIFLFFWANPDIVQTCFDCASKNPKWCSANIGIYLCYTCTGNHRGMGVHISFVRSSKMDRWKARELKQMEFGGNKLAREFYEENGMMQDGKPDHMNPSLQRYKNNLRLKACQAVGEKAEVEKPVSLPKKEEAKRVVQDV